MPKKQTAAQHAKPAKKSGVREKGIQKKTGKKESEKPPARSGHHGIFTHCAVEHAHAVGKPESVCAPEKDLTGNIRAFFQLWVSPVLLMALGFFGEYARWWSTRAAGFLWGAGILWIGLSCYANGRRCGRVHCKILGIAFPLLGLFGILIAFDVIFFSWNYYWSLFWIIFLSAYLPELLWKQYDI